MKLFPGIAFLAFLLAFGCVAQAKDFEATAKEALLMDVDSGTVLFAKNPDVAKDPASLVKLMTLEVMFHKLKAGEVSLEKIYTVSEHAWRTGGAPSGRATMFAAVKSEVPLEALLKAIAVESANDACLIIAEGETGSDEGFARLMNDRAAAIGLKDSHFTNSTGAPDPEQKMTLRDIGTLSRYLIHEYPEYYSYFSLASFEWNKIEQRNHNPLLSRNIGADGLALGYSEDSGYMISASANKNGQRLLAVMSGLESEKVRASEAQSIIDWGFSNFRKQRLFAKDEIVGQAIIYGGAQDVVDLASSRDAEFYLPLATSEEVTLRIAYMGPLLPPIEKGGQVATLQFLIGEHISQEVPLLATQSVPLGSLSQRAGDGIKGTAYRLWKKIPFDEMWEEIKKKGTGE